MSVRSAIQHAPPLLTLAAALALLKCIQFAVDSTALLTVDSTGFLDNAFRFGFFPERSYFYGYLIRIFALSIHSLRAIVAMQVVMGGITAWLLGFALLRYLKVRASIAIAAALVFACDPVQVVYEHLVMTETAAIFAMAVFLVAACGYLAAPRLWRLAALSFFGIVLVGMRLVYVPLTLATAVLLPLAAYFRSPAWPRPKRSRALFLALAVSCVFTMLFHVGYKHLTGRLAGREPAYHYKTGFFLVSAVAPIVQVEDAGDPAVARAIAEQNLSPFPLAKRKFRAAQLWYPQGLVARLRTAFNGDERHANAAAQRLAHAAILRDPAGFLKLGVYTWFDFARRLRGLSWALPWEIGWGPVPQVGPHDVDTIRAAFGTSVANQNLLPTPSRRYAMLGGVWYFFLLASPFLAGWGLWMRPRDDRSASLMAGLFFLWSWLLLIATCLGTPVALRYLHPLSFTGLAGAAFLAEKLCRRQRARVLRPVEPGRAGIGSR